jgi:hypothetical protein
MAWMEELLIIAIAADQLDNAGLGERVPALIRDRGLPSSALFGPSGT